jgi:hypothetical protein
MADVAMFYWINDIRPDFENKVKDKDSVATWQHVTFYGLSIGAVGTFDSNSRDAVTGAPASVVSGTPWPKPLSNTADRDRRSLARGRKQPRALPERPDLRRPSAEGGKSCEGVRCAAVGHRQRRGHWGRTIHGKQELGFT